jgi:hypothetical protein
LHRVDDGQGYIDPRRPRRHLNFHGRVSVLLAGTIDRCR